VQRCAVLASELELRPLAGMSARTRTGLAGSVRADYGDGMGVKSHVPFAGLGFRSALLHFPAELGDLPADRGDGGSQVGVGTAQSARLAAAQAAQHDQVYRA
jgi:hypothetical protein